MSSVFTTIFSLASYVSPENPPSFGADRKKWEAGVLHVPSVAQQTLEETSFTTIGEPPPTKGSALVDVCQAYKVGKPLISFLTLFLSEQTAGVDIQMCSQQEEAPRKVWPVGPDSQVLRVLQEAELQPLTQELGNVSLCDEESSCPG